MEILTPKSTRRSTRIRVEIPVNVTSLDRKRPFADSCTVLVVSAQGCGFRSAHPMPLETPILLSGLPGGRSVTGRVANCLPLGNDGKQYLVGAALYTHGNVWGITDPPADWASAAETNPAPEGKDSPPAEEPSFYASKRAWPYNVFAESGEAHPGRK